MRKTHSHIKYVHFSLLFGFLCSLAFHYYMLMEGKEFPYTSFLFLPTDRFMDYINLVNFNRLSPAYSSLMYYPPVGAALFKLFSYLDNITGLILFLAIPCLFFPIWFYKSLNNLNFKSRLVTCLFLTIFSYPLIFTFDRANLEFYVFIATALFLSLYGRSKLIFSFALLSIAGAMKPFIALFYLIPLKDKKYLGIMASLALILITSVVALIFLNGAFSENLPLLSKNLSTYKELYVFQNHGLFFGHSLFNLLRYSTRNIFSLETLYSTYKVAVAVSSLLFFGLFFFSKSKERTLSYIVCSICLFPFVSSDYKLIYIYLPLVLLINKPSVNRYEFVRLIGYCALAVPRSYIYINDENYGSLITGPIILTIILLSALTEELQTTWRERKQLL